MHTQTQAQIHIIIKLWYMCKTSPIYSKATYIYVLFTKIPCSFSNLTEKKKRLLKQHWEKLGAQNIRSGGSTDESKKKAFCFSSDPI